MVDRPEPEIAFERGPNEEPNEAVVRATAALTNRSVVDRDPPYDVLDPDQLDGIFAEEGTELGREERSVTFDFNGCHVSVTGQQVVVRAPERDHH